MLRGTAGVLPTEASDESTEGSVGESTRSNSDLADSKESLPDQSISDSGDALSFSDTVDSEDSTEKKIRDEAFAQILYETRMGEIFEGEVGPTYPYIRTIENDVALRQELDVDVKTRHAKVSFFPLVKEIIFPPIGLSEYEYIG
jgi:hypothetical protein